ncbi:MAG: alpha-hydroxy-acid oxidizing protein [Burkholderiaceae bacterium]
MSWDHIVGATEIETTLRRNRLALHSLAGRPQVLRDVSQFDASLGFLGRQLRFPVLVLVLMAPVTWPNLNISR